jgi:hypothetical protein
MIFAGDGYVYTQVPFKSNDEGIYGLCAPTGAKNMKDSVARIKCFYILLENYKKGERYEYLVTMIPAKQMETQGRDYDFLSKPNFTGLVIYSSLKGKYIREEIYKNGIVYNGKLWSAEEYRNVGKTKDGVVDGGTLDAAICTADKFSGNRELEDWMNANKGLTYNYVTKNTVTEEDKKPGGGGNGTAITPNINCNINIEYLYCDKPQTETTTVSRGGSWSATARDPNPDCKFIMWYGDLSSSLRRIQVDSVQSDMSFFAKYVPSSNKKCFLIAQLLDAGYSRMAIEHLLKIYTRDYEQSLTVNIDGKTTIIKGTKNSTNNGYEGNPAHSFVSLFHTHPGLCLPSDMDFYDFCVNIGYYYDPASFEFGIISKQHEIFIMKVKNIDVFYAFLSRIKGENKNYTMGLLDAWYDNVLKFLPEKADGNNQIDVSVKLKYIGDFLNSIGLTYYILNSTSSTYNGTTYYWSSLNYEDIEGTDDCFNH